MSIMVYEYNVYEEESRTVLYSHVNMLFFVKHVTILSDIVNKVDVSPFTLDYQAV